MLNLALVGLMAGSLAMSPTDDGKKGTDAPKADAPPAAAAAGPSIFTTTPAASPETIQDQFAFGRSYGGSPLRLWVSYAWGEAEGTWGPDGEDGEIIIGNAEGDIISMRAIAGAEIGLPVNLFGFGLSAGAQLTMAKNEFQCGAAGCGVLAAAGVTEGLESSFGLQQAKFYGELRTNTLGIHAGYLLDIGDEQAFTAPIAALGGAQLPTDLSTSDSRDAFNIGASFDYPSEMIRLFGGVDYYDLYAAEDNATTTADESAVPPADDVVNALFGLGFRASIFEIGAALQIQSRFSNPTVPSIGRRGVGGSAATLAPYLRISPGSIPASLFVKGAVWDEYTDFGLALGGSNSVKPSIGFTAGLTFGFN